MKNFFLLLIVLFFLSCTTSSSIYTIKSPNKQHSLQFEWISSLLNHEENCIKISIDGFSKNDYLCIRSLLDFPVLIHWDDTITIYGGILINSKNNNGRLRWVSDYTEIEAEIFTKDPINWKHYYLQKIPTGYYK